MDTMCEALVRGFKKAGLELQIANAPLGRGVTREVFGMDIQNRKKGGDWKHEYFRIWPGEKVNIQVQHHDPKLHQLILMVHEKERTFTEKMSKKQLEQLGNRWKVLKEWRDDPSRQAWVEVERMTTAQRRHFLLGVDERQMFVAQLPKACATVRDAHDALKNPTVWLSEGQQIGQTKRQGEWFFLHTSEWERKVADYEAEKGMLLKKQALGTTGKFVVGNAHIVDEMVVINRKNLEEGGRTYIRGKVRHPEHKTVTFKQWMRVLRNQESNFNQIQGVNWID